MNIPNLNFFALVPLQDHHLSQNLEVAVCPSDTPFMTMPQLEQTIEEKKRNEHILQKTNEALMTFTNELKRLKKVLVHAVSSGNQNES